MTILEIFRVKICFVSSNLGKYVPNMKHISKKWQSEMYHIPIIVIIIVYILPQFLLSPYSDCLLKLDHSVDFLGITFNQNERALILYIMTRLIVEKYTKFIQTFLNMIVVTTTTAHTERYVTFCILLLLPLRHDNDHLVHKCHI